MAEHRMNKAAPDLSAADGAAAARPTRRRLLSSTVSVGAVLAAPAILSACAPATPDAAQAPSLTPDPAPTPAPSEPQAAAALRPTNAGFPAILDTVNQLDLAKARRLRELGATTVFRYYSYVPSNIRGKDLTPSERDAIFEAGLAVGVVFQHYNNCFDTFANDWGARDAEQSLVLAELNRQPQGSGIYFGVDGDFPFATMIAQQIEYMRRVNEVFAGSGYRIGVYGGGCVLDRVRREGLAELFWLSGSTGFTGTKAFYNQGDWTMFQNAYDFRIGGSVGIDTNFANPTTNGAVGQWSAAGVSSGDPAATRRIFDNRRFTRRAVDIFAEPRAGAATLTRARRDANVRLIAIGDDWAEIVTREGGDGVSTRGFVAADALTGLERFTSESVYGICGAAIEPTPAQRNMNCTTAARDFRA